MSKTDSSGAIDEGDTMTECPNCKRTDTLAPIHLGARNLLCNWCWSVIRPDGGWLPWQSQNSGRWLTPGR